ncbi:MAG: hypothetical protein ABIO44_06025 [Saprospiraceae bacterium]
MITLIKLISILLLTNSIGYSQYNDSIIYIKNGSFEGLPNCCRLPEGWVDCGWRNETPPDIQPASKGEKPFFGVIDSAFNGNTYLGMVVRQNNSYERVSQKLEKVLEEGKCYSFSIYLMRSEEYSSPVGPDYINVKPFTTPTILRIWGGNSYCHNLEFLAESNIVKETEWTLYEFNFAPKNDLQYLHLEAFYDPTESNPYNGNILLDNASDIKLIPCEKHKKKRK